MPKKAKNPTTSVTVVRMTEPANAGSSLNLSKAMGMSTPNNAAVAILTRIANAIVAPISVD